MIGQPLNNLKSQKSAAAPSFCGTQLSLSAFSSSYLRYYADSQPIPKAEIREGRISTSSSSTTSSFPSSFLPPQPIVRAVNPRNDRPSKVGDPKTRSATQSEHANSLNMLDEGTLSWNARYELELDVIARRHSPVSRDFSSPPSAVLVAPGDDGCCCGTCLRGKNKKQHHNATCLLS